jgi:hypothetical protein
MIEPVKTNTNDKLVKLNLSSASILSPNKNLNTTKGNFNEDSVSVTSPSAQHN